MISTIELRDRMSAGWYNFNRGRDWNGWCQAFVAWASTFANGGVEPHWYGSAREAWNASPAAASMDPYAAPPGALHWFTAGHPDYDVKLSFGGGRVAHAYRNQDVKWPNLINIGEDDWESAANKAPWMRTTYLGWTYGFGPGGAYTVPLYVASAALQPHERRVVVDGSGFGANRRIGWASTSAPKGAEIAPGETGEFKGFVRGESVNGNNIWFVGLYSGDYFWSGSFVGGASTAGLTDITPAPTEPTPPVVWAPYVFEAFSPVVTAVIPAHPSNLKLGSFPSSPSTLVLHDFGTKGLHTYGSVINYFTGDHTTDESKQVSAHFVVSGDRIVQMVSLSDRAYHAGPGGNDFIGIEIDPEVSSDTDFGRATLTSARKLIAALRDAYAKDFALLKHPEVPGNDTSCGDDINKALYVVEAYAPPVIDDGNPSPVDPTEPVDPTDPVEPTDPVDPIEPTDPTEPTDPVEPVEPTDPEEPTVPTDPTPTDPVVVVPPKDVTPEQEQAAAELVDQFVTGQLLVGDAVLSKIRTFVPILVGPIIAFLVQTFPAVAEFLDANAGDWRTLILGAVSVAAGYGWWALARFLGKRWPLAEKLMLGSSKQPVYIDRVDSLAKN